MTEIEQLKADLTTLRKAVQISHDLGFQHITVGINTICGLAEKKIADLEAQQELIDPWRHAKEALYHWDANDREPDFITKRSIFAYIQNLQAKVDEMNHELRCERIDGDKVWDDLRARIAEMEQHGRKVDQANHEHYGRLQDQIAIRDLKIEKLEGQLAGRPVSEAAEALVKEVDQFKQREKLAELVTIQNAIPPACGLARELVERRISEVKKEMQG